MMPNVCVGASAHHPVHFRRLALVFVLAFCTPVFGASVTLNSPADGVLLNALNVSFSYVTDLNVSSCSLYANVSGGWSSQISAASATTLSHAFGSDAQYLWAMACTDGNQTAYSDNRTLRIDSTPPSTPSGLNASGSPSVNLTWTASADHSAVTYRVFRNGTHVANVTATSHSDTIPESTTFNYSVQATDAAGLYSGFSTPVLVNGPVPSVVISNFAIALSSSGATFSWTASPAANASVTYAAGNTSLTVSSASPSTSANLPIAGLAAATTYSYNATACAATCTAVTGTFRTLPSSYPSPSQTVANGSTAGSLVRFSTYWSDALALSHYIFSSNASGTWANTTYAFNGSYSNHSLTLPSTAVTLAWLFYANNSQNALNATAPQSLAVIVAAATATPTATATPAPTVTALPTVSATSTPLPTVPPELVRATSTPQPTPAPTATVVPTLPETTNAPSAIPVAIAGVMGELVLDARNAEFALSPTGLVVGVNAPNADVVLSSNFTNQGDPLTVQLQADLNGSSGTFQLSSQPATVEFGRVLLLQTLPQAVLPGEYDVVGKIVAVESGQVLDQKSLRLRVASAPSRADTPTLTGFLVLMLAMSAALAGQLNSVKKEFA